MFLEAQGSGDSAAARPGVEAELYRDSEPVRLSMSSDLVTQEFDGGLVYKLSPQRLESVLNCLPHQHTLRQRLERKSFITPQSPFDFIVFAVYCSSPYYAAVLIGRIVCLICPSVCLSVRPSCTGS